jgi:hypothetical protein
MYGTLILLYISHIRIKLKEIERLQIVHGYFLIILTFQVQTDLVGAWGCYWEQAPPRKIVGSSINLNLVLHA